MRILLTGAAGFIGSHLSERLCRRGDAVLGLDNFDLFYGRGVKERNLAGVRAFPSFQFVEGDITDPSTLEEAMDTHQPELVVHLAALAGVRPSIADPLRYDRVNVTGTLQVLEACRARGVRHVVFASSSSVYGVGSQVPFRESDPCGTPASPYAASKRAGELMAYTAHHLTGIGITCLRFFTVYGPRQRPDLAIHKFTRLIAAGKPIELFGDGSTSRDYTWVDDIVDGTVAAIDRQAAQGGFSIYNLGGSHTTTLARLVELIAGELGVAPVIERRPPQPGDMERTLADVSLAGTELGYSPKVGIEEGIRRFVAWFREERRAAAA